MKDIELKLASELMKNARRSDRELSRTLKVSQPTVTRLRTKLEKEEYFREYTMIPEFSQLGFEVMAVTFFKWEKTLTEEEYTSVLKAGIELEQKEGLSIIMVARGIGLNHDLMIISIHETYSAFRELIRILKQLPLFEVSQIQSFLVDLTEESRHGPLTFSALSGYLLKRLEKKNKE
jgi:DNA-binding Lrp family transcriptional regulator